MPPLVSYVLLAVATIFILYLIYRLLSTKRWIRLYMLMSVVMVYLAAAPTFKLAIKASGLEKKWGFDVDAVVNESSWVRDAVVALVIILFFILENNYTKGESHYTYIRDFQWVVLDNMRDGIEDTEVAKRRNIPIEKVQAIIICAGWLEGKPHKRKPKDSTGGRKD